MDILTQKVSQARRRLLVQSFVDKLGRCLFWALVAAAAAIAGGKLWPGGTAPAWTAGWLAAALVAGVAGAAAWTWRRRPSAMDAALEIDRRAALKERVSSSLSLDPQARLSAAGQALVRDAGERLRRESLPARFCLRPDRWSWRPLVPAAAALALAALVPARAVESPGEVPAAATSQRVSTERLAAQLRRQRQQAAARGHQALDPLLAELEQGVLELGKTSANDRKQTLLALNDLMRHARERRDELAAAAELKQQLASLKQLAGGPGEKLGQALRRGEFGQAARQLDELSQALAAEPLEAPALEALAAPLAPVQQALDERAAALDQRQAAMARQEEIERRSGDLARAAQVREQAEKLAAPSPPREQLAAIRQAMTDARQSLAAGQREQAAAALARVAERLAGVQESLEQTQVLDAALRQVGECKRAMACQQCQGQGCGACQEGGSPPPAPLDERTVRGPGNRGVGSQAGGELSAATRPAGQAFDARAVPQPGEGAARVVGQTDGPNRRGPVREEIQSAFAAGAQQDAAPLDEQQLPRDYRAHAQRYFDLLREGDR